MNDEFISELILARKVCQAARTYFDALKYDDGPEPRAQTEEMWLFEALQEYEARNHLDLKSLIEWLQARIDAGYKK